MSFSSVHWREEFYDHERSLTFRVGDRVLGRTVETYKYRGTIRAIHGRHLMQFVIQFDGGGREMALYPDQVAPLSLLEVLAEL